MEGLTITNRGREGEQSKIFATINHFPIKRTLTHKNALRNYANCKIASRVAFFQVTKKTLAPIRHVNMGVSA